MFITASSSCDCFSKWFTVYVSSQKSGTHPLENPGQKRDDKSSSAILPRNIEKILVYCTKKGFYTMFHEQCKTLPLERSLARDRAPAGPVQTLPLGYTDGSPS